MIKVEDLNNQNTVVIKPTDFPDGTKLIKYNPTYAGAYRITWLYDNDAELFQLIALVKHLKNSEWCNVWLNMPYVPNARMDRVKNTDEVFTLKYFADVINWLGFKQVTICNPHSTVSEALFDRVYVDFNCVAEDVKMALHFAATDRDVVLYFPDEGACKRYSDLLSFLELPVAFGIKMRDWKTGKILGIDIAGYDDLKDKNVMMIDDICAYGGTFYYSALRLKELGAKDISCYVTHLENSVMDKEKGKLIDAKWYSHDGKTSEDLIKTIYTTNSIFRGTNGLGLASHKIKIVREF